MFPISELGKEAKGKAPNSHENEAGESIDGAHHTLQACVER